jgi:hypothetical protein
MIPNQSSALTTVPGLPKDWRSRDGTIIDLSVVPPSPYGVERPLDGFAVPVDPDRLAKVAAWESWAQEVLRYRTSRWLACDGLTPGANVVKERARERFLILHAGPKYFITVWCHTYEARAEPTQEHPWHQHFTNGWLPAILYPYQYDLIDWIEARNQSVGSGANGAVSKSRDVGVTTVFCFVSLYHWLFTNPFSTKLVSRKEDLVDDVGNLDSMMERIASHLFERQGNAPLPRWMLPQGLIPKDHRHKLKITRPDNRNIMTGESTSQRTGRGGRSHWIYIDEAAYIEDLQHVLTAVQNTASHVFVFSSESVQASEAFVKYQEALRKENPETVFVIDFWVHPYHGIDWFEQMRSRHADDLEGFMREVMRDPFAGFGGWMYDLVRQNDGVDFILEDDPDPNAVDSTIYLAIDPGFKDDTAIHWIMRDRDNERDVVLRTLEASGMPPEYYAAIIVGVQPGDYPEFHFSPRVLDLMEWVRSIPQPKTIFGDPHGTHQFLSADDTFYSRMAKFFRNGNPRKNEDGVGQVIPIMVNWKQDARRDQGRRSALQMWLRSGLKFANNPTAIRTLVALQQSRWNPQDRPTTTEQKQAKHDEYSHRRTALEYAAVNLEALPYVPVSRMTYTARSGSTATSVRGARRAARVPVAPGNPLRGPLDVITS